MQNFGAIQGLFLDKWEEIFGNSNEYSKERVI